MPVKRRPRESFLLILTTVVVISADRDQVAGDFTPDRIYLAAERLMIERTYPARPGLPPSVDEQFLLAAELHALPAIRQAAVRAVGRFEDRATSSGLGGISPIQTRLANCR